MFYLFVCLVLVFYYSFFLCFLHWLRIKVYILTDYKLIFIDYYHAISDYALNANRLPRTERTVRMSADPRQSTQHSFLRSMQSSHRRNKSWLCRRTDGSRRSVTLDDHLTLLTAEDYSDSRVILCSALFSLHLF